VTRGGLKQDWWRAILTARDDIDKLVAKAVGDYPSQPPPRATTARPAPRVATAAGVPAAATSSAPRALAPQETTRMWRDPVRMSTSTSAVTAIAAAPAVSIEQEALHRLHQDVLARIKELRSALSAEQGVEQAMLGLVLYFDERIMDRLPAYLAPSWPLLQEELFRRNTGGSDFFRLIDRLIEGEQPPELVLEVYYFCLADGFEGQYADDPPSLDAYKQRLRGRITAPEPERPAREPAATPSGSPIRSRALYYVVAALAVVVVAVLLTAWSNR
jgi:type IV/VI secretion system ImpK/VasF family protein